MTKDLSALRLPVQALIFISTLSLLFLVDCTGPSQSESYLSDSTMITAGQALFETHCGTCHLFAGDGSGPALGGITTETSPQWVEQFIADPMGVIASGDDRAVQVDKEFVGVMPAFGFLPESDIQSLVAYIHSNRAVAASDSKKLVPGLKNPIPEAIELSDVVVEIEPVFTAPATAEKRPLARITKMEPSPFGDLFLVDLNGVLYRINNRRPETYLDLREEEYFINKPGLATGFGSFAFHPDFVENGRLYTTHTEKGAGRSADFSLPDSLRALQWILTEWQTDAPGEVPFHGTSRELMRIDYTWHIHGVQNIAFNTTATKGDSDYGHLYIGAGDGRAALNGYPSIVEGITSIWGALLRIDPLGTNSGNGQYGIPSDNPFVGETGAVEEIFTHGFRNPHLFMWRDDGRMILTNIGEKNLESIYVIEKGADYGWPRREGNLEIKFGDETSEVYPLPPDDSGYTYPAAQFDHDEAGAICGGYIYEGAVEALRGKYLFGSIVSGRLFFVDAMDLKPNSSAVIREFRVQLDGETGTLREHFGGGRIDLRYGYDADGDLYIMTKFDGSVYKIKGLAPA